MRVDRVLMALKIDSVIQILNRFLHNLTFTNNVSVSKVHMDPLSSLQGKLAYKSVKKVKEAASKYLVNSFFKQKNYQNPMDQRQTSEN